MNQTIENMEEEEDYDLPLLNNIREKIEKMPKFNQIEVLRLLHNHKDIIINENKYGIHINLTELTSSVIEELKVYINYVSTQEFELNQAEQEKENYKNIYFDKR